ncbi:MAG TPA: polymer-forming cytoskeletal protein [Rhizomicrobium sp.]|nr:polymer-forming cytoskeletal protein [Rhizomicrobium sp.]
MIFNRNDNKDATPAATGAAIPTPRPPQPNSTGRTPMPEQPNTSTQNPARPQAVTPSHSANTAGGPMTSVISKALKITGQLESTENIQIDGQIDGDVRGVNVKVGNGAKVKGTVYGEEVELAGTVEGKIEAKKVVLTGTAHMSGDVVHQDITIQSGAHIDGHCKPDYGKTALKTQPTLKAVAGTEKTGLAS